MKATRITFCCAVSTVNIHTRMSSPTLLGARWLTACTHTHTHTHARARALSPQTAVKTRLRYTSKRTWYQTDSLSLTRFYRTISARTLVAMTTQIETRDFSLTRTRQAIQWPIGNVRRQLSVIGRDQAWNWLRSTVENKTRSQVWILVSRRLSCFTYSMFTLMASFAAANSTNSTISNVLVLFLKKKTVIVLLMSSE